MQHWLRGARLVVATTLLAGVLGGRIVSGSRLVVSGGAIEKVLALLKDLKADIVKDGLVEQETYNKYACWCEKATAKKAEVINQAHDDLRELGQRILTAKGEVAVLQAEMKEFEKKIQDNQQAQEEATSVRQKENEEYLKQTAEVKTAMIALERAVKVLIQGTVADGAFLQQGAGTAAVVKSVIEKIPSRAPLKSGQLSQLGAFVSGGMKSGTKYMPQSMTVQGILTDMYATFASDVERATAAEAAQNRDFEGFVAEAEEQMSLYRESIVRKGKQKAKTEKELAGSSQLYDDTEAQMNADIEFFDETKAACQTKSKDWDERHRARHEELQGVTQAIEMLSSDEARELFARAIKPGKEIGSALIAPAFVQLRVSSDAPQRAFEALQAHAFKVKSIRLALLAASTQEAKVGHFDGVIKAIDAMILNLKKEDAADIAKRDQCKEEFKKANSTIAQLSWEIKVSDAKIENLGRSIAELKREKTKVVDEITEAEEHMREMEDERQADFDAFNASKKDDRDAIDLLVDTRDVLISYYANNSVEIGEIQGSVKGLALEQGSHGRQDPVFEKSQFDAPEVTFSGKSVRAPQGKAVISMLTSVIEDLYDEITASLKAEKEAQLEFERMCKAAEQLKQSLEAKKVLLQDMIATDSQSKTDEEHTKTGSEALLTNERDYRESIKPDCNFVFSSFEERARKRAVEMEGLVSAKGYLAGYAPGQEALLASTDRLLRGE